MRESNNQNFKYCLYGAVAIVAFQYSKTAY